MSQQQPILSVILPAYKEADNLRLLLPRLHQSLGKLVEDYELIVVDTLHPMDDTSRVCEENKAVYINRQGGEEYGQAVRTGIGRALGEFILFMDADCSHDPEFIPKLWDNRGDYDVVIASRYVDGGSSENSPVLVFISKIVNFLYPLLLGLPAKDVSNSFKLYRGDQLKILTLTCRNLDVIEEILYKLKKNKSELRILEVPFRFRKRLHGDSKRSFFTFVLSYFITLIRLRLGLHG